MFWIALPDGSIDRSWTLRLSLAAAYLLMGAAGFFLLLSPMFRDIYQWRIEIMAWFLLTGGFLGLIGTVTRRWFGEFTGLPLLSSAFAVFGLVTMGEQYDIAPKLALANAFLLWSVSAMLVARWRVSFAYYRMAMALGSDDE